MLGVEGCGHWPYDHVDAKTPCLAVSWHGQCTQHPATVREPRSDVYMLYPPTALLPQAEADANAKADAKQAKMSKFAVKTSKRDMSNMDDHKREQAERLGMGMGRQVNNANIFAHSTSKSGLCLHHLWDACPTQYLGVSINSFFLTCVCMSLQLSPQ